ncbi:TetR/AcrR family transcriptional regulator [Domibacillus sp. PGB-M46]|uniref:TetR/AcrR family transcriptional regulator n=1 Tax=Domibacillus sp. PGB-M46 TaxID=2910255 RepID=UPI001F576736|nr:TetR/AcrR family transcriptional regulator [Domibacillus sp. PGB-M46]MCI2253493.1 TetR/AcrR family transcriptional regulator [Domibacillus sp. PGB-M46]
MASERKKDIIEAATKSFTMFGYKATTMDQVAKLANVGKGTIYTFFKNKDELFQDIWVTLIEEMKEAAEAVIDPAHSFQENVYLALFEMLVFRTKHQLAIKLFQEEKEMGTPAAAEALKKMEDAIVAYIAAKAKEAMEKNEIEHTDPEIAAFVMLKLYVTLVADWERRGRTLSKEEIAKLFELFIFKGLSR